MDEKYLIELLSHHFPDTASSAQFSSQTHTIDAMTNLLSDYETQLAYGYKKPLTEARKESLYCVTG